MRVLNVSVHAHVHARVAICRPHVLHLIILQLPCSYLAAMCPNPQRAACDDRTLSKLWATPRQ